jgi:signal transduction histidine kinase
VREPVELAAIVAMLLERYNTRAEERGVSLAISGGEDDPVVWGDPGRLLQAASNLVENALRVTPAGASVELELKHGALAVSDRGPGLSQEEMQRAFERFYLHRRHRDATHDGSGLGLAIVSELMSAMGGTARAQARQGGGVRFTLTLDPVGASNERGERQSADPAAAR